MTYEKKTQEGIAKDRIEELNRIRKLQNLEEPYKDESYREPLSIDTRIEKKILLSWGGGSDGFKLYFSDEKELLTGVYFYANWGEYIESELTDDEAELVFNFYMGGVFQ